MMHCPNVGYIVLMPGTLTKLNLHCPHISYIVLMPHTLIKLMYCPHIGYIVLILCLIHLMLVALS